MPLAASPPLLERTVLWNHADLAIPWPVASDAIVSAKDQAGRRFADADYFA
jgi:dTDP-4-dehydrorhamnose 3,5-epimerase